MYKVNRCRPRSRRRMTGIALSGRWHMGDRLALGTLRRIAPRMASRALTIQPGMVHSRRNERDKIAVAGVTGRRRRDMVCLLTGRIDAIVTSCAGAGLHTSMRISRRRP